MQVFQKKWFTLVELMVVVVILWVLGAVGMVSYTSYLWGSRDSNRLTQLSDIRSGLNVYAINKNLPTPEDKVDVLANANIVAYQWYAWEKTLRLIGYNDGGTDPLDGSFFTYYLTKNKKDFQLMGFLEEESALQSAVIPQTYADDIDYSERIPTVTGKKLWALVENGTNTPIQEILSLSSGLDIATTGTTYNAYYTDQDVISWTGSQLIQSVSNQNCNRILELWNSIGSGIYKISPTWNGVVQVYCDMETDGGGWTMILNYLHKWWTNPLLNTLTNTLPLRWSNTLGIDEQNTPYWWHATPSMIQKINFSESYFYCKSSSHDRVIHFKTDNANVINYIEKGIGSMHDIINPENTFNLDAYNWATIPLGMSTVEWYTSRGNNTLTEFPIFGNSSISWNPRAHWGIRAWDRWECDDGSVGDSADTHHSVFIR